MKSKRTENAKPNYGGGSGRAAKTPRGAPKEKKPREEEQNSWNTKVLEVSSCPAEPEVKNYVVERGMLMLTLTGKKQAQRSSHRLRCGIEDPGLIIDERKIIIRRDQTNAEE
jgi:hypothetical protein